MSGTSLGITLHYSGENVIVVKQSRAISGIPVGLGKFILTITLNVHMTFGEKFYQYEKFTGWIYKIPME